MDPRKLDARHKIQLGGLVIASGVRDTLGLSGDLQRDESQADAAAVLAGALQYVNALLTGPQAERARAEFLLRGRDLLAKQPSGDERSDREPRGASATGNAP